MVKRIIVAFVLLPLFVFLILTKYVFLLWMGLVFISLFLTREMLKFFPNKIRKSSATLLYALVIIHYLFKILYFNFFLIPSSLYNAVTFSSIFVALLLLGYLEVFQKNFEESAFNVAYGLLTFVYGTYFFSFVYDLKYIHSYDLRISEKMGGYYILYASIICWLFDTGAYFGGKFFGKKTLGLASSPNKTWMGLFSGIFFSAFGMGLLKFLFDFEFGASKIPIFHYSYPLFILVSVLLGLNSQLGDLFESVLKRSAGLKDSGKILPGHGGIFDRTDSLIPTYFLVFLIIYIEISL